MKGKAKAKGSPKTKAKAKAKGKAAPMDTAEAEQATAAPMDTAEAEQATHAPVDTAKAEQATPAFVDTAEAEQALAPVDTAEAEQAPAPVDTAEAEARPTRRRVASRISGHDDAPGRARRMTSQPVALTPRQVMDQLHQCDLSMRIVLEQMEAVEKEGRKPSKDDLPRYEHWQLSVYLGPPFHRDPPATGFSSTPPRVLRGERGI